MDVSAVKIISDLSEFKSVLRLLQVVKHQISDGDWTPPEAIPPKEAGVLNSLLPFGKTPTSKRSEVGEMIKTIGDKYEIQEKTV